MKWFTVLLYFKFLCVSALNNSNLVSVLVVSRHGVRTPKVFAPNDPYNSPEFWPGQPGELTNLGIRQHYELGEWLRDRYSDFLPLHYLKEDIYVRASEIDRCLMSAEANLAGMYPPKEPTMWIDQLPWHPLPIHSLTKTDDSVLEIEDSCPKYVRDYGKVIRDEDCRKIDEENSELYSYLSKYLGVPIKRFTDVEPYYDTLVIEALYGYKLPEWTKAVFPEPMKALSEFSFKLGTKNSNMKRLATGSFFELLVLNFNAVLKNSRENLLAKKLVMFFGHQTNICDISNTLGTFKPGSFASALIFELRKDVYTSELYLNLLYKTNSKLEVLKIVNCDVNCKFDEFLEIIGPYRLNSTQFKRECL